MIVETANGEKVVRNWDAKPSYYAMGYRMCWKCSGLVERTLAARWLHWWRGCR